MRTKDTYTLKTSIRNRVLNKTAALGGDGNDVPLEEMFGQLTHTYLQDKAPSLMPYEQGFQVVERNEDDTKVLGVTGFKVNGMQLFSPTFCINGEIKGHELLRLADQNLWVPLKEAWLNEIFRRKPMMIGDSAPKSTPGSSTPDLTDLVDIPTKYASAIPREWHSVYRDIAKQSKFSLSKKAFSLHQKLNPLRHLKYASYGGLKRTLEMLDTYPLIKAAFEQVHPGGTDALRREFTERDILRKSAALRVKPLPEPNVKYANSVQVISYSVSISGSSLPFGLSDKEKEKLLREGYLVQDDRRDEEVTKVIDASGNKANIFNPRGTGIYDVLVEPGKSRRMVVLRSSDAEGPFMLVVNPSSHEYCECAGTEIWCTKEYPAADYVKWVDNLPFGSPSDCFAVLRGCCEVHGPFNNYTRGIICKTETQEEPPLRYGYGYNDGYRHNCRSMEWTIRRTPKGSDFRVSKHTMELPKDMKLLELHLNSDLIQKSNGLDQLPQAVKAQKIKESAYAGLEPLKVSVWGDECRLNQGPRISTFEGFKSLVEDYGLREKTAKALLKKAGAEPTRACKVFLKRAELVTPPIPQVNDSPVGILTDRLAAGPSGQEYSTTKSHDVSADPYISIDSDYASQDVAAVNKAIQSGQKDIFDVSMLKSLYTSGDTDSMIDEQTAELTRAMTEAGDLLFRFYWKGDQFKEIYGPKNLPELEANLKKLFEILGDVVLFLKRNRLNQADYETLEPLNLSDNSK